MDDSTSASWTAELLALRAGGRDALLDPDELRERASKHAGLSDFGGGERELAELCRAFNEEPRIGPGGRLSLSWHVIQALITRLRLVHTERHHPERFARRLNDPIVLVGLPRSGTTFLHGLLCALPKTRFLRFWEAREPIPGEGEDDRITRFALVARLVQRNSPDLADKHPVDLHGPEECMYLLDPSFLSVSFMTAEVPSTNYLGLLLRSDMREPYRIYRRLLEYLQALAPDARLVLKSPTHLGALDCLLAAVPEARVILTHRDPLSVVPSLCSLYESVYRPSLLRLDREQIGRDTLMLLDLQLQGCARARKSVPPHKICDLTFTEVVGDPRGSVRAVFEHFGWPWSDEHEAALGAKLAAGAPEYVGRHRYSLSDYGLDPAELVERFSDYRARWGFDDRPRSSP